MAESQQLEVINNERTERTRWLLDSPEPPSFFRQVFSSIRGTIFPHGTKNQHSSQKNKSPANQAFSFFKGIFPILEWGRMYKATKFKNDLMAGLTLASLSIPQSIGYANLAKLDPQYGLYTSVVPPLIYAMMGSSRELAIGPVAVVSLLISALIEKIVDPAVDPVAYRRLVFTATFFTGIFQAGFGLFRLGFLVDFLSHAAIVGFMAGAAIIIGLQQLKGLIGISHFTTKTDIVSVLEAVFRSLHPPFMSPLNFVLGCSFLIFILMTRFIGRKNRKFFWLPAIAPLLSVVFSTLIVYLTRADKHGVNIVKHFKGGLNPSSVHELQLNTKHIGEAARIGLICACVALTEAIAVGRSFASIRGYRLDGNKEMRAMGCMNIVGSLTSCYVATGSFSRTAVNFSAGCETAVSNIVMAITVFISLQLFTKLLYYTPLAILASIILSALPGLIDIHEAYHIWKVDKLDFIVCLATFLGVLFGSVEIGLLVAVCISFVKVLVTSIRPSTEVLGKIPGTNSFCDVMQYPMATKISGLLIKRINSPSFCFANANFIRERLMKLLSEENEENKNGSIHVLILDLSNVVSIDTSGIIVIEELHKELLSRGIELALASPRWHVVSKLKLAKLVDKIGKEKVFLTVEDAIDACFDPKTSILNNC